MRENTPAAGDAFDVKPGHALQQEADGCCLCLIWQHLNTGQPCGVINGEMDYFAARTKGSAKTPIAGDPVPNPLKAGHLFGVDMHHVVRLGPFVLTSLISSLQMPQTVEPHGMEHWDPVERGAASNLAALMKVQRS